MKPAAIDAQLVNARNVGCHKSVALTLHIPEERAAEFFEMFGWPTMANPIPIAIARLQTEKEVMQNTAGSVPNSRPTRNDKTPPRQEEAKPSGGAKTAFRDMRLPNQAGILCDTPAFRKFLRERLAWLRDLEPGDAADAVRKYCNVKSRSDIRPRTPSGDRWLKLVDEYRTWMHQPELVA